MELIENQPIVFNQDSPSCSPIVFNQLVGLDDTNQFQLILEPCGDASNLISNGAFNDSTDWGLINFSIADNQACASGGIASLLTQGNVFEVGKYYRLTFEIVSGTNTDVSVAFGDTVVAEGITGLGVHTVFGFATDTALLIASNAPGTVCLTNVYVYEIETNFGFAIKDNNGTIIYSDWLDDYIKPVETAGALSSYDVFSEYFTLVDGYVTVSIKWGDFGIQDSGCYTICLLDPCENENFLLLLCDSTEWSVNALGGSTVSFTNSVSEYKDCEMYFEDNPGGGVALVTSLIANNFVPNTKYTIKFTLSTMTDTSVSFTMGTVDTIAYTTNGNFEVDIIPDADSFIVRFEATGGGLCRATLTNLSIHVANEYLSSTTCSDSLKLGDYSGTQLINACNDTDAFGFLFEGTGFSPSIRLESQLDRAQYDSVRSMESNSVARLRNTFYQRTKKKRLAIEAIPEYLHNFVSLLFGFDHMYIDGVEYVVSEDEEYVVSYDADDYKGTVAFNVTIKEQLVRNAVTSAEGEGCNTTSGETGLVDEATGLYDLSQEASTNEDLISENE